MLQPRKGKTLSATTRLMKIIDSWLLCILVDPSSHAATFNFKAVILLYSLQLLRLSPTVRSRHCWCAFPAALVPRMVDSEQIEEPWPRNWMKYPALGNGGLVMTSRHRNWVYDYIYIMLLYVVIYIYTLHVVEIKSLLHTHTDLLIYTYISTHTFVCTHVRVEGICSWWPGMGRWDLCLHGQGDHVVHLPGDPLRISSPKRNAMSISETSKTSSHILYIIPYNIPLNIPYWLGKTWRIHITSMMDGHVLSQYENRTIPWDQPRYFLWWKSPSMVTLGEVQYFFGDGITLKKTL